MNKAIPECIMSLVWGKKIHARWCREMYIFLILKYIYHNINIKKYTILLNISIYCVLSIYLNTIHICVYFAPYLSIVICPFYLFDIDNIYIIIHFSRLMHHLECFFLLHQTQIKQNQWCKMYECHAHKRLNDLLPLKKLILIKTKMLNH